MELNMKRFSAKTNVNPAFKKAQPLPALPGHLAATSRSWLQLGCAGWLKFRAAAKPQSNSGQSLVGTALHAAAQSGNIPRLAPAWAGRNF
jgi:hypothetical protein